MNLIKKYFFLENIVRYDVLHPQRALVLRELAKALDDPKRAVRKEAVEARYARFALNSCYQTCLPFVSFCRTVWYVAFMRRCIH